MYSAVITQSGQVTLPKELREFLGVKPGERILFDRDEKENKVYLKRKLSLEEYTAELNKNTSRKTRKIIEKSAGMSVSEMMAIYAKSPRGRKELQRRYGI